jgi:hypothetical protein
MVEDAARYRGYLTRKSEPLKKFIPLCMDFVVAERAKGGLLRNALGRSIFFSTSLSRYVRSGNLRFFEGKTMTQSIKRYSNVNPINGLVLVSDLGF